MHNGLPMRRAAGLGSSEYLASGGWRSTARSEDLEAGERRGTWWRRGWTEESQQELGGCQNVRAVLQV